MARKAADKSNISQTSPAIPGVDFDIPGLKNALTPEEIQAQEERDLVNQLLGQAQMADGFGKFSVTVTTSKLAYVKENKLYRALKGQKSRNGYEFLNGTWAEFCELLGTSCEKADLDITNLRTFGEEALESMSRMGIGYRELRQFRKLPADSKIALIEAAKQEDKEVLLDLAEELIANQVQEKEKLTQRLTETKADLEASRQHVSVLKTARDALEEKLTEAKYKPISDNELAERCRLEATPISSKIVRELLGALQGVFIELEKDTVDRDIDHSSFMAGLACEIRNQLDDIVTRFSIPDLVAVHEPPEWAKEPAPASTDIDGE